MFEEQHPDSNEFKKIVKKVAKDWFHKTGETNLLGSVEKELFKLLPLVIDAIAESDLDMAKRVKPLVDKNKRISVNLTSMNAGIKKALSKRDLQDGRHFEDDELKEQIRKMYAHLGPKKVQEIIDCCPVVELEDHKFHILYPGSKLCVTLPNKIKRKKRENFTKPEGLTNFHNKAKNMKYIKRAYFVSPYEQYHDRNGEEFEILKEISEPDSTHDAEVLPMYIIRFKRDKAVIEAWPEEIFL